MNSMYNQEFIKLIQEKGLDLDRACMFVTAVSLYNSGRTNAFNPFLELVGDSSEEFDKYRILLVNKDYEEDKWHFRVNPFGEEVVEDDVWKWLLDNANSSVNRAKRELHQEAANYLNSYEWDKTKLLRVVNEAYEDSENKMALATFVLTGTLIAKYREIKVNKFDY